MAKSQFPKIVCTLNLQYVVKVKTKQELDDEVRRLHKLGYKTVQVFSYSHNRIAVL